MYKCHDCTFESESGVELYVCVNCGASICDECKRSDSNCNCYCSGCFDEPVCDICDSPTPDVFECGECGNIVCKECTCCEGK